MMADNNPRQEGILGGGRVGRSRLVNEMKR